MAKNILFRCDASEVVSLGHLKRSIALAKALTAINGVKIGFATYDDPEARELLGGFKNQTTFLKDMVNTGLDMTKLLDVIAKVGADMVVVDSYSANAGYFSSLKEKGIITVYFEDFLEVECSADVIINGLIDADKTKYISPHQFLGLKYLILAPEYWEISGLRNEVKDPSSILITMGGSDHHNITPRVLGLLNSIEHPMTIHTVIGHYYNNLDKITAAAKSCRHDVVLHYRLDNIRDVIQKCQIAISGGGMTLYELAVCGVPTIGIALSDDQRNNVMCLGKKQVIISLDVKNSRDINKEIGTQLNSLLNNNRKRQDLAFNSGNIIDGRGAMRVSAELVKIE